MCSKPDGRAAAPKVIGATDSDRSQTNPPRRTVSPFSPARLRKKVSALVAIAAIASFGALNWTVEQAKEILDLWVASGPAYASRIAAVKASALWQTTSITNDGEQDTMVGQAGNDWFLHGSGSNERIMDRAAGEQVN